MFKITVLGTEYDVSYCTEKEDRALDGCKDGYFDRTVKRISIVKGEDDGKPESEISTDSVRDLLSYRKEVLRHEIVHAFVYESGLTSSGCKWAEDEQFVEWVALQIKKMAKCMADAERKLEEEYRAGRTD